MGAVTYAGEMPLILKLNSANSLAGGSVSDQAVTATVDDALRLGCVGVGFTIYPGSDACYDHEEELRDIIARGQGQGAGRRWSGPTRAAARSARTARPRSTSWPTPRTWRR